MAPQPGGPMGDEQLGLCLKSRYPLIVLEGGSHVEVYAVLGRVRQPIAEGLGGPERRQPGRVGAELLVTLARACRDAVRVWFRYAGRDGAECERTVEPVRMVTTGRRWYLMAWDVGRDDWRTFRLDRMREGGGDNLALPRPGASGPGWLRAAVRDRGPVPVSRPGTAVRPAGPGAGAGAPQVGRVEDDRDGWCALVVGGNNPDWLAMHVARLGFDAEVLEPPELREAAARLGRRLAAMAGRADGLGRSFLDSASGEPTS